MPAAPLWEEPAEALRRSRSRTLFPGGFKRSEIQVPALVLRVGVDEVLGSGGAVVASVARGVWIVVVESARALKAAVREHAYLLIP
jgi:hypothetical protein